MAGKYIFKNGDRLKRELNKVLNRKEIKNKIILKKSSTKAIKFKTTKPLKEFKFNIKPIKRTKFRKIKKITRVANKAKQISNPYVVGFSEINEKDNSSADEKAVGYTKKTVNTTRKKVAVKTNRAISKKLLQTKYFGNSRTLSRYLRKTDPNQKFLKRNLNRVEKKASQKIAFEAVKVAKNVAMASKAVVGAVATTVSGIISFPFLIVGVLVIVIVMVVCVFTGQNDNCVKPVDPQHEEVGKPAKSIDDFIKSHKEAYIQSWKAGGFLPSASIAQSMVENGFNFTNPSGTSFWKAHNMGGVKTSKLSDFPITIATYGKDSIDITGTKAGTSVGDNTGGAYTYFKDYNAGIVGKAEFMAHQTLYKGAINNTNPQATLTAIYMGGWATDPKYLSSLLSAYNTLGQNYKFIDDEAIKKYGKTPYQANHIIPNVIPNNDPHKNDSKNTNEVTADDNGCVVDPNTSNGKNGAPVLDLPKEYIGKLTLPMPDDKNYSGNNYPFGQCTWGVYNRLAQIGMPIEWFSGDSGNGGNWGASAKAKGYKVEKGKPQIGWGASVPAGVAGSDPVAGHIAVVEYINPDGSILVSETNVVKAGTGTRSWRVLSKEIVSQILFIQGKAQHGK